MWLKWLPWSYIVRRAARAHGFIDPITILSRLNRFAQPSEVNEPIELLRAGVIFHARGLINTRVIQHNLDWIWPYWVQRQFDPSDQSFIPRSFSITHVNLTHRNWTAVGIPDCQAIPIVDPRGLVTPFFDGWSIDAWILTDDGEIFIPAGLLSNSQQLFFNHEQLSIITESTKDLLSLRVEVNVQGSYKETPVCRIRVSARCGIQGWLVIALRPYNPEGISFIHEVGLSPDRRRWIINEKECVRFSTRVERHHASKYRFGDVILNLKKYHERRRIECEVGLATAAALFKLEAQKPREIIAEVLLSGDEESSPLFSRDSFHQGWSEALKGVCSFFVPDQQFRFLFEAAIRTLILHSPSEVYPGPYTYKRFWFRDSAFILHAMLTAGLQTRVQRALTHFFSKQTMTGYFHSQEGEWDSNGEALWIMHRFCQLSGLPPPQSWNKSIIKGGKWIKNKRLADNIYNLQAGLLPAGFSAEHLGPNDYYYWDDFWGVAGLLAAASMVETMGNMKTARIFRQEAEGLMKAIEMSLDRSLSIRENEGIPASPYRRMDAGAIGSLLPGYPLQLWPHDDYRILATVEYLLKNCLVHGAFFQDMIHSGLNAYLTLHIAQVLLRAKDIRFYDLVKTIANLASPTGQWPEAIHPRTGGGCMGDGQHVWASAEWILIMRNIFVREEEDRLILGSGIVKEWLDGSENLSFGPTLTRFGNISVKIEPGKHSQDNIMVSWQASWHKHAPLIEISIPACPVILVKEPHITQVEIKR